MANFGFLRGQHSILRNFWNVTLKILQITIFAPKIEKQVQYSIFRFLLGQGDNPLYYIIFKFIKKCKFPQFFIEYMQHLTFQAKKISRGDGLEVEDLEYTP